MLNNKQTNKLYTVLENNVFADINTDWHLYIRKKKHPANNILIKPLKYKVNE